MTIDEKTIKAFQKTILNWYNENKRDLPWRKTRHPYHILISEVMLQQTQVNRVITKFEDWLRRFPTVETLASAPVSDVLKYWSGLGYNRRALNLKRAAEAIVKEHKGIFPQDEMLLLKLPGIGPYTSRAILCFAFDQQVAVVDTNVKKVILTQIIKPKEKPLPTFISLNDAASDKRHRESVGRGDLNKEIVSHSLAMTDKDFQDIAEQLLPHGHAYDWNQALMDYASHVLKKEKIPIPKQSKFEGSHRYYRSGIVKLLLEKKEISISEIGPAIKKDYSDKENDWLQKLLDELIKEGFIVVEKKPFA